VTASAHFVARVRERMGRHVDPHLLAYGLTEAIRQERRDLVEFVCRTNRKGYRMFRFRDSERGKTWYALIDTEHYVAVTVMPPGFMVGRMGKSKLQLREIDL
jgi:hypothetical protein